MSRKALVLLLLISLCIPLFVSKPVQADMGPKPSVVIDFTGLEGQEYYVSLLSEITRYGPWNADAAWENETSDERALMQKFRAFAISKNTNFLGHYSKLNGDDTYSWGYHPPQTFQIMVYFPDSDMFLLSDKTYERYAFHSYYRVNAEAWFSAGEMDPQANLAAVQNYDFGAEIIGFALRLVLTLAIELGLAWLLFYRRQKQLQLILAVNLFTQIALNLVLAFAGYKQGPWAFIFFYFTLEILIFAVEAIVYRLRLLGQAGRTVEKLGPVVYALAANVLSFGAGLLVSDYLLGLF